MPYGFNNDKSKAEFHNIEQNIEIVHFSDTITTDSSGNGETSWSLGDYEGSNVVVLSSHRYEPPVGGHGGVGKSLINADSIFISEPQGVLHPINSLVYSISGLTANKSYSVGVYVLIYS